MLLKASSHTPCLLPHFLLCSAHEGWRPQEGDTPGRVITLEAHPHFLLATSCFTPPWLHLEDRYPEGPWGPTPPLQVGGQAAF